MPLPSWSASGIPTHNGRITKETLVKPPWSYLIRLLFEVDSLTPREAYMFLRGKYNNAPVDQYVNRLAALKSAGFLFVRRHQDCNKSCPADRSVYSLDWESIPSSVVLELFPAVEGSHWVDASGHVHKVEKIYIANDNVIVHIADIDVPAKTMRKLFSRL